MRDVVVTGVGVLCAFGRGLAPLAAGIRGDESALRPLAAFEGAGLEIAIAAEYLTPLPDRPGFADDRKAALALAAAEDAVEAAAGDTGSPDLRSAGVWLGTGLSSVTPRELAEDAYRHLRDGRIDRASLIADVAADRVSPWRHLPERVTAGVAERFGAAGPQVTSFSACAAGAQAIALAMRAIRRGDVDAALCGGHDAMIHPLGVLSFTVLGALSSGRCRPFDRRRDGFTIGEGAAILVLEAEETARARGAPILARVLGAGTSVDAWNVTAPHPEGLGAELSMRRALADAGLDGGAVDHVNAHGTGTPLGDVAEARAIGRVVGPDTPVSSIKGAIGHCIAAAGAVEAAACVAGLSEGWSPGTAGLSEPDDLPASPRAEMAWDRPGVLLSNSFGFGGQNATLALGAPDWPRR